MALGGLCTCTYCSATAAACSATPAVSPRRRPAERAAAKRASTAGSANTARSQSSACAGASARSRAPRLIGPGPADAVAAPPAGQHARPAEGGVAADSEPAGAPGPPSVRGGGGEGGRWRGGPGAGRAGSARGGSVKRSSKVSSTPLPLTACAPRGSHRAPHAAGSRPTAPAIAADPRTPPPRASLHMRAAVLTVSP
jgi:hypothetical protein